MRISLNLSKFFEDHRSLAKIFINKNFKCIKDVEKHITNIFGIENFYLKCDNHYLPEAEDVHVLNEDEVVWAIPFDETTVDFTFDATEEEEKPKVKKKKKHKSDETMEVEEEPLIQKKKKTKKKTEKLDEPETKNMKEERRENEAEFERKKKKRSFDPTDTSTIERKKPKEDFVSQNNGNLKNSSSSGDESFTPLGQNSTSVKSLVDSFENKCARKNHPFINNAFEKRVNIVKTIIISNGKTDMLKDKKLEDSSGVHSNSSADNINTENNDASIRDDSSITTSNTDPSNLDICQPRKRKRTRRHKNKKKTIDYDFLRNLNVSDFLETSKASTIEFKPLEKAPVHVRFDEEDSDKSQVKNITDYEFLNTSKTSNCIIKFKKPLEQAPVSEEVSNETKVENKTENEKQEKSEENKCNGDVVTKPAPEKNEIANGKLNGDQVITLDEPFDEETFVKCMLQFPVISGIEPRIGDVIAFKILRISENYTPEISSWIVGKVVNYKNKEVTFDITHGQDQCVNPQGKFCLEQEEPEEQSNEFKCLWQNVIEPRCIYP
ncbi:coilin [Tribolium castaneum]|uniref:Uncharacterized protein n=1 Tax=Tribolium castaneum TaxID=7070 RepID=D7ELL1_TRICA|nr:PREDICTED: coilin [Tribolium castaneum]EFA12236.1 hypothetical protein TcasGA2_TC006924 [Tribolium castaneum]|eukprot:XP_968254.2 PREDICTED: coilin [Tribolium castaneum]